MAIVILFVITVFLVQACCDPPFRCDCGLTCMNFNYNFNPKDSSAFALNDQSEFYVIRTNINTYVPIDSNQVYFSRINDSTLQMMICKEVESYSNCNFIISNRRINYADTISQISFKEYSYTENCTGGCPSLRKKKRTCTGLDNLNFMFNKTHLLASDPPILISKK
jgi:hypothetical protein